MLKQLMQSSVQRSRCFLRGSLLLIALIVLPVIATAESGSDPVGLLRSIADHMIAGLKREKATLKTNPQAVYRLAYRYVVPYADLGEMSKRVVPPAVWNKASASQKQDFEHSFTRLLIRTYASALTSYSDQSVNFFPVRGNVSAMTNVEVSSEIVSPSTSSVRVVYRLLREDGTWRLYDMSVEGVSLIESFRAQFASILANGDMATLLQALKKHQTEPRS